ncbi:hypothetical protein VTO42DRAFT_8385 [Malbranchea cinnamomea]
MDWEIYDLDGDEIVIRRPRIVRPWRDPPSSKPMPRTAGSITRPRRCEQVRELIRLCGDHEAPSSNPSERTLKAYASYDGFTRKLKEKASKASLRGESGGRRPSKPKLRLQTVLNMRSSEERSGTQTSSNSRSDSLTSFGVCSNGSQRSLLSADKRTPENQNGNGIDYECYSPGVAVLSSLRNSLDSVEEEGAEQQKETSDHDTRPKPAPEKRNRAVIPDFINLWNKKLELDNSSRNKKTSVDQPTGNGQQRFSADKSPTKGSFDYHRPGTSATSTTHDSKPSADTRLVSQSSGTDTQGIALSSVPDGSCQFSSRPSQEYLMSRIRDRLVASNLAAGVQAKEEDGDWPILAGSIDRCESQLSRRPITSGKSSISSLGVADSRFSDPPKRNRLAPAPLETVSSSSGQKSAKPLLSNELNNLDPTASIRLRRVGNIYAANSRPESPASGSWSTCPIGSPKEDVGCQKQRQRSPEISPNTCSPFPQQSDATREERNFPFHRWDMATARVTPKVTNTQSISTTGRTNAQGQVRSNAVPPTTIPEHPPRKFSVSLPQSPRTECPSTPPKIPLPADPPIPPRRGSLQKCAGTSSRGQLLSERLGEQAPFDRSAIRSRATSDIRRRRRPPPLRSNWSGQTLCNYDEIEETSESVSVSVSSSARVSKIEYPDNISRECSDTSIPPRENGNESPTLGWYDLPSPKCVSSFYCKSDGAHSPPPPQQQQQQQQQPRQPSRQSSRTCIDTPEPLSPKQLESRLAFLERQNQMLQAALIAALDVGVGVSCDDHFPWAETSKLIRSTVPSPVSRCASINTDE